MSTRITAEIKDVASGEIQSTEHDYAHEDFEAVRFHWTEGNYGCDCNRELFYLRAAGKLGEDELIDSECTEGRYLVRLRAADVVLLDEFVKPRADLLKAIDDAHEVRVSVDVFRRGTYVRITKLEARDLLARNANTPAEYTLTHGGGKVWLERGEALRKADKARAAELASELGV